MGAVYEADHLMLRKKVAIKMLLPKMAQNEEINQRFEEEARRAALVKHPGIIDVSDLGRDTDGSAYMEMELLHGKPVTSLIEQGTMPLSQAIQIMTESLEALNYAHQKGLVHRDLKPDNLFYSKDTAGNYRTKLLDFGIAKLSEGAENSMTQTGSLMGTPHYMSPEQAMNSKEVDHRSDIYSMGATFYEMLTGKRPVEGNNINELLMRLLQDKIDRHPKALRSDVPEWLDAVIAKAMAKEAAARPQSAQEMLDTIQSQSPRPTGPIKAEQIPNETLDKIHLPTREGQATKPETLNASAGEIQSTAAPKPRSVSMLVLGSLGALALVLLSLVSTGVLDFSKREPAPEKTLAAPIVETAPVIEAKPQVVTSAPVSVPVSQAVVKEEPKIDPKKETPKDPKKKIKTSDNKADPNFVPDEPESSTFGKGSPNK
jgi:serine/threonine protein kinase